MWCKLSLRGDLDPGEVVRVKVQGLGLAIARHEDRLYALEDRCPHAGALLSTGTVVDGRIVCPWHGREFELASGSCEGFVGVRSFAVDQRADGVYVLIDPQALAQAGNTSGS